MSQLTIQQAFDLALKHHQAGQLHEAEQLYRQILYEQPEHYEAMHYLGLIANQVGKNDIAIDLIRQAIALRPNYSEAHNNLGIAFKERGQLDEAIIAWRQAIIFNHNFPEAHNNLGSAMLTKGQFDEAIAAYRQAIALNPDYAEAHCNLGNGLRDKGQLDDAITACRRAISLKPNYAEAHNNLGNTLHDKGQLDEAIAAYRQSIAIKHNFAEAYSNLGMALEEKGAFDEAIAACRRAIVFRLNYAEAHCNLGNALNGKGQLDDAIAAYRQAIAFNPGYAEAHYNLGNGLKDKGQLDEAIAAYRQAIAINPNFPQAHNNLGSALKDKGRLDDAIAVFRQAIALESDFTYAHSSLLFAIHYHPAYDAKAILEEHRRWNGQYAEPLRKFIPVHSNNRSPGRRLRIGYISPDFCEHPVGRFVLLPLLTNHNHEQFEVFCYSDVPARKMDEVAKRLRGYADRWRDVVGQSDEQVAKQIREDQIDLLIDTTAHTAGNRMLLFARKPAPVQITSFFTTGLSAMDYRLTDQYSDPPGQGDEFYSEQSIRLPHCFWCLEPTEAMPEVNALPALSVGHVTFGSFNNFAKINPYLLQLWIEIMQATPGSRLILQCPPGDHRIGLRKTFEAGGVAAERIELVARGQIDQYFKYYHRVDICLDPTPYAGHTTSFDALWMGVPLVTLSGRTMVGRAGVSVLSNIGLTELIARTPEEYVLIAVKLAGDLLRLTELRATMRKRMLASPVMDAVGYACDIEAAYRSAWQTWCKRVAADT